MSLKICAMSDLHGYLPPAEEIEDHEVTLISGDISPLEIQANNRKMKKWLLNEFKPWCESLPNKKVYFIAGNHDWVMLRDPDFMKENFSYEEKTTYLYQNGDTYNAIDGNEYSIFGTPYCQQFCNWAFMEEDSILAQLYSLIPENLDILLTHDQPYGYGDVLLENVPYHYEGEHIGNKELLSAIFIKQPNYLFCGHLHSTTHNCVEINNTKRYNVSLMTEKYYPIYDPLYLEIEKYKEL